MASHRAHGMNCGENGERSAKSHGVLSGHEKPSCMLPPPRISSFSSFCHGICEARVLNGPLVRVQAPAQTAHESIALVYSTRLLHSSIAIVYCTRLLHSSIAGSSIAIVQVLGRRNSGVEAARMGNRQRFALSKCKGIAEMSR